MLSIEVALSESAQKIKKISASPRLDAEVLLLAVLNQNRRGEPLTKSFLYTYPEFKLTKKQLLMFKKLIARCAKNEPVAYIVNNKEFYGLDFFVDKNVLIPRPDTEILVDVALREISQLSIVNCQLSVLLDIGTGSGCISIAVAKNLPLKNKVKIFAIDNSLKALSIAKKNAKLNNVSKLIKFSLTDVGNLSAFLWHHWRPATGRVRIASETWRAGDRRLVVTANLPYISTAQYKNLPPDVKKYEPKSALVAGVDGLKYYRQLFQQISNLLAQHKFNLVVLIEIDPSQTIAVKKLIKHYLPSAKMSVLKDLAGRNRIVKIEVVYSC